MSTSITKQGILLADGVEVGENLILNGNAVEFNGTYVSGAIHHWANWSNSSDRSIEHVYGKDWFHFKTPATTTYGGFYQDHIVNGDAIRIKPNTKYTVSAIWFASAETNGVYWFHWRSSEGGVNLSQNYQTFTVTTTPQRITRTFTSGTNATYTVNRFNLMMGVYHHSAEGVDIYFTDVKMEEGEIATPWTPATTDDIYVGDHGFFEGSDKGSIGKGYMEGNEFYEI